MKRVPPQPPADDDALWQDAVRDVVKLGEAPPNRPKTPKLPPATGVNMAPNLPAQQMAQRMAARHDQAPLRILANSAENLAGCCPSVPPKTYKKLAAGGLEPQGVLDLHGLGEGDAWLQLEAFLHDARRHDVHGQPVRVVLVIHGKGRGHGHAGDMGVIKSQMAARLARHPAVLAFHTATPDWGGRGAVVILLRSL